MRELVVDASFYERRPLRVAADLVRAWVLVGAALAAALLWPHPAVWAGAAVVIGTQLYALEILLHDGLHRTLLSSKASTDWLCRLFLTYPLFTALGPFRWKHLEHHKVLGKPEDPDRYYYTAGDKGSRPAFLFFCTGLSAAWSALRALARPRARRAAAAQAGWIDWALIAVTQAGIAALLTWLGGPLAYLFLWVLPFGLFVFLAQSLRSFSEHARPAPDGDPDGAGGWSRMVTFTSNPLERLFFAPLNMNYHAEHHLYPQVPYYHLPRLRETLRAAGELDAVEVRGSYLGFLWSYWRSLPASRERSGSGRRVSAGTSETAALRTVEVGCCVCGAQGGTAFARGWDFEYGTTREELPFVRCVGCGHVYLTPRPDAAELSRIYPGDYYSYDMERSINWVALKAKAFLDKRKAKALLRLAPNAQPRCLDVGCGDGRNLEMLALRGVPRDRLHGVELSEKVVEKLRARGLQGHYGRIEEVDLPAGSFDFITMFQVIEHVADPAATLRALARLLAPGGVLVIETPNVKSLDARLFRRRYWGGYHFPRHWNLFDKETLARLGRQSGLEPTRLETFVCAVFWIYPFHHWLREKGLPRPIYRFFWPGSNPLLLAWFTAVDVLLAPLGLSSNLRAVFRRPA